MRKKLLKLITITLLVLTIAPINAVVEKTEGKYLGKPKKVKPLYFGFPKWYGYHSRYYCPYHRIYHRWEFRCPRFNDYYRPWEREWKYPRPMLYRKKDNRNKVYWKLLNATPYSLMVYPQGADPVKLSPSERERVYRFKSFKLRIGNNQVGFREFRTKKHYIKVNTDGQRLFFEKTNNKDIWKTWKPSP